MHSRAATTWRSSLRDDHRNAAGASIRDYLAPGVVVFEVPAVLAHSSGARAAIERWRPASSTRTCAAARATSRRLHRGVPHVATLHIDLNGRALPARGRAVLHFAVAGRQIARAGYAAPCSGSRTRSCRIRACRPSDARRCVGSPAPGPTTSSSAAWAAGRRQGVRRPDRGVPSRAAARRPAGDRRRRAERARLERARRRPARHVHGVSRRCQGLVPGAGPVRVRFAARAVRTGHHRGAGRGHAGDRLRRAGSARHRGTLPDRTHAHQRRRRARGGAAPRPPGGPGAALRSTSRNSTSTA